MDEWMKEYYQMQKQEDKEATILQCAEYCIDYGWSVRRIAEEMMIPKSTVHEYLTYDLKYIDDGLYQQAKHKLAERRS